jgi:ribonuclease HII
MRETAAAHRERLLERDAPLWREGLVLAGVDEAGRGPLAGPVVAAAVIWRGPPEWLEALDDSKRLGAAAREWAYAVITRPGAAFIGVGAVGPATIDRVNIHRASALAMRRALARLPVPPDWVLTDFMPLRWRCPVEAMVRGDSRSASVAAASVVAKVLRDRYMDALHGQYPQYGFDRHRGYATRAHRDAIVRWGPSPAHRLSFVGRGEGAGPAT